MSLEQKVNKGGDNRTAINMLSGAGFGYILSGGNPLGVVTGALGGYIIDRVAARSYYQ